MVARKLRVILESPMFTRAEDGSRCSPAEIERNMRYLKRAALDSLLRDEDPLASCLIYPQVLNDAESEQRKRGIEAGLNWGQAADKAIVYSDHGVSNGMVDGIERHESNGLEIEYRRIGVEPEFPVAAPAPDACNCDDSLTLRSELAVVKAQRDYLIAFASPAEVRAMQVELAAEHGCEHRFVDSTVCVRCGFDPGASQSA